MIKKFASIFLLASVLVPTLALAEPSGGSGVYGKIGGGYGVSSGDINFLPADRLSSIDSVKGVIKTISNYLLAILIAVSVFFILWAAYLYLRSGGEEKATGAAKGYLIYAAVAIAVALFARALPSLVNSIFTS